ncbi:MAG TPA: M14 family zinc carboxypeptidase [Wenzhouxiangellaceae bacterium]|nr:M14 family zinc carboxypeptidase [Wenzhouxiangellaceae bacterium]
MRFATALVLAFSSFLFSASAVAVLPGLPDSVETPGDAPSAGEILGFEPGERHPYHHELLDFYRQLAEDSDRVRIETIGRSHGGREQILVYFASPERLPRIGEIRADRRRASVEGDGPPVVWLGYSVHGNEASGASAAVIMAWYLAHADDEQVRAWLDEMVIVMEPVINPDGGARFAHWVNMHKGRNPSADPNDREHNEGWPYGRTSYYWFDLNRDWLPLTHPVSRQRIEHYRKWRPHVLTDAHEMGRSSSYFFQPGIPERNNPATPARVFELTRKIADYHGEILDQAGEPYYSRESFDDYYLGKGSTYPDLTGGIGILFEQGSSRGHRMETPFGERTFADAIANQVRTSISTLNASRDLAGDLIAHQADFFSEAREIAGRGGWLLGDDGDPMRARRLLEILLGHGIEVHSVSEPVTIGDREYGPGEAWAIPAMQDQYRFIEAIFSTPTELPMETFYDVSSWPLQHAFGLPLTRASRLQARGSRLTAETLPAIPTSTLDASSTAWVIDWQQHRAPAVLAALLAQGYRVQATETPLALTGTDDVRRFVRGSIVVHHGIQPDHLPPVEETLATLSERFDVAIAGIGSGLAREGSDLGSPSVPVLEAPRPILLTGDAVSPYGAGYVWHWFDTILDQPLTRIDADALPSDLDDYTHIIMPPGDWDSLGDGFAETVTGFVRQGGQLVALGGSAEWAESLDLDWSFDEKPEGETTGDEADAGNVESAPYADYKTDFARTLIGGSALAMTLDVTHPLGYGYADQQVTVFRQGSHLLRTTTNRYATPGRYADEPLVAGYLSGPVSEKLAGTAALAADRHGRGVVVRIADDYLFRGYWVGTERLFANALFFGQLVDSTRMPD